MKDAAAVSSSVETRATCWAYEIEQCMDASTVSFLDPAAKGVRGLIVI